MRLVMSHFTIFIGIYNNLLLHIGSHLIALSCNQLMNADLARINNIMQIN